MPAARGTLAAVLIIDDNLRAISRPSGRFRLIHFAEHLPLGTGGQIVNPQRADFAAAPAGKGDFCAIRRWRGVVAVAVPVTVTGAAEIFGVMAETCQRVPDFSAVTTMVVPPGDSVTVA